MGRYDVCDSWSCCGGLPFGGRLGLLESVNGGLIWALTMLNWLPSGAPRGGLGIPYAQLPLTVNEKDRKRSVIAPYSGCVARTSTSRTLRLSSTGVLEGVAILVPLIVPNRRTLIRFAGSSSQTL